MPERCVSVNQSIHLNQNNNKLEKHFLTLLLMKLNNKNEIKIVKYVTPICCPNSGFYNSTFWAWKRNSQQGNRVFLENDLLSVFYGTKMLSSLLQPLCLVTSKYSHDLSEVFSIKKTKTKRLVGNCTVCWLVFKFLLRGENVCSQDSIIKFWLLKRNLGYEKKWNKGCWTVLWKIAVLFRILLRVCNE